MAAHSGSSSSVPTLPPPCPKSPPEYPDLYGKRRETAKVQVLEREIGFLEEELKTVEGLHPASRYCKEVTDFVVANSDPLIPINQKKRRSCHLWKWLCGTPCFNFSWLSWICCFCHSKCSIHVELPRCCDCSNCNLCSCNPCTGCSIPKCRGCSCLRSQCCKKNSCSRNCCICPRDCCICLRNCCICPRDCCICPRNCCICPKDCCICPKDCCICLKDCCIWPNDCCVCPKDCCLCRIPSCLDCSCCQWKCSWPKFKFPKLRCCGSCSKTCCTCRTCNPCCLCF